MRPRASGDRPGLSQSQYPLLFDPALVVVVALPQDGGHGGGPVGSADGPELDDRPARLTAGRRARLLPRCGHSDERRPVSMGNRGPDLSAARREVGRLPRRRNRHEPGPVGVGDDSPRQLAAPDRDRRPRLHRPADPGSGYRRTGDASPDSIRTHGAADQPARRGPGSTHQNRETRPVRLITVVTGLAMRTGTVPAGGAVGAALEVVTGVNWTT